MFSLTFVLILLIGACALNAISDILLFWGAQHTGWEVSSDAILKTPRRYLLIGSLAGLFILPVWFLPTLYLAQIDGGAGTIATLSYVVYIAAVLFYHVSYSFIGISIQAHHAVAETYETITMGLGIYLMLLSLVFTVTIIYLSVQGMLTLQWYHYATLPFPAVLIVQFGLGNLLRRVPWFQIVSGTLSMSVFFVGFIDLIARNPSVFIG